MKKEVKIILIVIIILLVVNTDLVFAESIFDNICSAKGVKKALKFVGYLLLSVKILIPLIIIVMGTVDLTKAITSSKEDEIKTATNKLFKKLIAGIIIFFIPTLLSIFLGLIYNFQTIESNYKTCLNCILKPRECGLPTGGGYDRVEEYEK